MMEFWFKLLFAKETGSIPPTEEEIVKFMSSFTQKVIVWGPNNVLQAYHSFRQYYINRRQEKPNEEGLFLFENLMMEMRKDLGHRRSSLKKGDILGLFLNDIKKYV